MKNKWLIRFLLIFTFSLFIWNISTYSSISNDIRIQNRFTIAEDTDIIVPVVSMTIDDDKLYVLKNTDLEKEIMEDVPRVIEKSFTISAVGDCTLGTDESYAFKDGFLDVFHRNNEDFTYFFKNVYSIFDNDDLTIANLETTLTTASKKREKKFRFRGLPSFTNILTQSSVEAVNLANNHTYDYMKQGFNDTKENLDASGVSYFSDEHCIYEKDGVKVGMIGYNTWYSNKKVKEKIKTGINKLKEEGCMIIIVSFHWGQEYEYYPNSTQKTLARFSIDEGADLIIGHHPHVLQSIEKYKDKYIVYSLGNFCFGGNKNPRDYDTMIFQQTFYFEETTLLPKDDINIIPCSISSVDNINNFQPTPLINKDYKRVIDRINRYSKEYNFHYDPGKKIDEVLI